MIIFEKSQEKLADYLSKDLKTKAVEIEVSKYLNGEFKVEEIDINFSQVLVLFPRFSNLSDRLISFFLMLNLCMECETIDAFIPYIPYSRQDKSKSFQTIINITKNFNVRYIITLDIHKNIENDFILNIFPHELYGSNFLNQDFIVVSPDLGAKERSEKFANYLKTDLVIIDKKGNEITNFELIANRNCLIVDDIIDSGKTLNNAINTLKKAGARNIKTCITHNFKNL